MTFIDWLSGDNNPNLPRSEFLYGTRHLAVIVIVLTIAITLSLIFFNKSQKAKRILFLICGYIFLFFEITQRVLKLIFTDDYSFQNIMKIILPLFFCSIMVCFIIVAIFSNKQDLLNFGAIGGFLVTLAYLILPAVGLNKTYLSFDALYSIISHSLGFIVSICLVTTRYAKFNFKDIWKSYLTAAIMIIYGVIMSLYAFPGDDYVFIINNPLEFEWIVPYQIIYIIFIAIYITIFYLTEFIINRIRCRNQKTSQAIKKNSSKRNLIKK